MRIQKNTDIYEGENIFSYFSMPESSFERLSIRIIPQTINFYLGELRASLPEKSDSLFDHRFSEYCNETILRIFENLIVQRVLICSSEKKTVPYFYFFKRTITIDHFHVGNNLPGDLGVVEEQVLKIVSRKKSIPATSLIAALISKMVTANRNMVDPWWEIMRQIIEADRLDAWILDYKKHNLITGSGATLRPLNGQDLNAIRNALE